MIDLPSKCCNKINLDSKGFLQLIKWEMRKLIFNVHVLDNFSSVPIK